MTEKYSIKINKVDFATFFDDIVEIVVDTNIFLPSMFTMLVKDEFVLGALKHTDNQIVFRVGAPVDISVTTTDVPGTMLPVKNKLFSGEITTVEPIFDKNGEVYLRIRGFDLGHRLTIGKKNRTFGDANPKVATTTEMQIVSTIAKEAGLIPKVDMSGLSSLRYHYVIQYDQTDWEFLSTRAQLLGYQVYVDGRVLNFQKAGAKRSSISPTDQPADLQWGTNLKRFEPRIISMGQVNSASAFGWEPDTKKSISHKATSHKSATAAKIKDPLSGSKSLLTGFQISRSEDVVMSPVIREKAVAKTYAEARFAEHDSQFVRASGEVGIGDPRLLAGTDVSVKGVGVRFMGTYYVTEAKHIIRPGEYFTKFEISGRNPYTIRDLIMGKEQSNSKINGVVIGVVTDINDIDKLGRVKVKYPWMPKKGVSELSSNWARVASPGAGKDRGVFFTPEVNDEVLIAFEHGDMNYPYVVGALWNKKDVPPKAPSGTAVNLGTKKTDQRIVRSRTGHVVVLDDTKGKESITIQDKTGKNSIIIDSVKKSMTIKATGDIVLDAGGKIVMNSKQDFKIDSKTKLDFSAQTQLVLEGKTGAMMKTGPSQLDMKPATVALKGTKVDLQGTAQTAIQGAQTSVKGSAMVEIQGALVKIN